MKKSGIITGLTAALVLGVSTPIVIHKIRNNPNGPDIPIDPVDPVENVYLDRPTDGTTPLDHNELDNMLIAFGVLHDEKKFKSVADGHAITNMVIKNDQVTHSERYIDGIYTLNKYITQSSFVKEAVERFYVNDKILYRPGAITSTTTASWSTAEPTVRNKDFINTYIGCVPNEMSSYVINQEAIISAEKVQNSEYYYEVLFTLNPEVACERTKREAKFNGGLLDYPDYESVTWQVALDKDWRVQRIINHEIYKVTMKMGVKLTAPVDALMTEIFYYGEDVYKIDQPTLDYYLKYVDVEVPSDNDPIVVEKSATDYLTDALLGAVMGGQTLDVNVDAMGIKLNGKLLPDIQIAPELSIKVRGLFGDKFYFNYDGDLQLSLNENNSYQVNEDFINKIMEALNIDIAALLAGDDTSTAEGGLGDLLRNVEMNKQDGKIHVTAQVAMDDIVLNLAVACSDEEEPVLQVLEVSGLIGEQEIYASIAPTDEQISFEDIQFVDLSNGAWIIDEIAKVIDYEGYTLDLHAAIEGLDINGSIDITKDLSLGIKLSLTDDIVLKACYKNDKIYVAYGDLSVVLETNDINEIVDTVKSLIGSDVQALDLEISEDTLETVLGIVEDVLKGIRLDENDNFVISTALNSLIDGLGDVDITIGRNEKGLFVNASLYDLSLQLSEHKGDIVVDIDEANAITYKDIKAIVEEVFKVFEGNTVDITLDINGTSVEVKAYYEFDLDSKKLTLKALINNSVYVEYDGNLKVSYQNYNYTVNEEFLTTVLGKVTELLDVNLGDIASTDEIDVDTVLAILSIAKDSISLNRVNNVLTLSISLDIEDVAVKASISIDENNNAFVSSIKANIETSDISVNAEVKPATSEIVSPNVEYVDLSDASWIIDEIINIVNYEGYKVDLSLAYEELAVKASVALDKDLNVNVKVFINDDVEPLVLQYIDSNIYVTYEDLNIVLTSEDISELVDLVKSLLPATEEASDIDVDNIIKVVLGIVKGLRVDENKALELSLSLAQFIEGYDDLLISINHNEKGLVVDANLLDLHLELSENKEPIVLDFDLANAIRYSDIKAIVNEVYKVFDGNTVDLNLKVNDIELAIKLFYQYDLDSKELTIKALVNDEIYVMYDGDLKVAYKKYNYTVDEEFLLHVINIVKDQLDLVVEAPEFNLDLGVIGVALDFIKDNISLSRVNDVLSLGINLDIDGTTVEAILGINDASDAFVSSIRVGVNTTDFDILAVITPSETLIIDPDVEYVDLSEASWLIDEIINVVKYDAYNITLGLRIDDIVVKGTISLDKNLNVKASILLNDEETPINLFFIEDNLYLSYDDIKLVLTNEDINKVVELVSSLLNNEEETVSEINLETILAMVYDIVDGVKVDENKDIILSLALENLVSGLGNVEIKVSRGQDSLVLSASIYDLVVTLSENKSPITLDFDSTNAITYDDLMAVVNEVTKVFEGNTINAELKINDIEISAKLYYKYDLDTKEIIVKALINDEIFVAYDGNLKVAYKKYNYTINEEFILHLINSIKEELDSLTSQSASEESVEEDILTKVLNILKDDIAIVRENNQLSISALVNISDIELDASAVIDETSDAFISSIKVETSVEGIAIAGTITPTGEVIVDPEVEFVDLSNAAWIIDEIINVIHYDAYEINLGLEIEGTRVDAQVFLDKDFNVHGFITLSKDNEEMLVEVHYINEYIYLHLGQLDVKLSIDDISDIVEQVKDLLELSEEESEEIDILEKVMDVVLGVSVDNNNSLVLSLALDELYEGLGNIALAINHNEQGLVITSQSYSLELALSEYKGNYQYEELASYIDKVAIDSLFAQIENLKEIITSKQFSLTIDSLELSIGDIDINASIKLIYNDGSFQVIISAEQLENVEFVLTYDGSDYYLLIELENDEFGLILSEANLVDLVKALINDQDSETTKVIDYLVEKLPELLDTLMSSDEEDSKDIISTILGSIVTIGKEVEKISLNIEEGLFYVAYDTSVNASLTTLDKVSSLSLSVLIDDIKVNTNIVLKGEDILVDAGDISTYYDANKFIELVINFVESGNEHSATVEDIIAIFKDLNEFQGYIVEFDTINIQGIKLSGHITAVNDSDMELKLHLAYLEDEFDFFIYYVQEENEILLCWEDYILGLKISEISEAIEKIISLVGSEDNKDTTPSTSSIQDYYDIIDAIVDMFTKLCFSDYRRFELALDVEGTISKLQDRIPVVISDIVNSLTNIEVSAIYQDKVFDARNSKGEVVLRLSEFTDELHQPSAEGKNFIGLDEIGITVEFIEGVLEYIEDRMLEISTEGLYVKLSDESAISVDASIRLLLDQNNELTLDATVYITAYTFELQNDAYVQTKSKIYYASIQYKDDNLYIIFSDEVTLATSGIIETERIEADSIKSKYKINNKMSLKFTRQELQEVLRLVLNNLSEGTEFGNMLSTMTGGDFSMLNTIKDLLDSTGIFEGMEEELIPSSDQPIILSEIMPTVMDVLNFIKGATLEFDINNKSFRFAHIYDFTIDGNKTPVDIDVSLKIIGDEYKITATEIAIGDIEVKGSLWISKIEEINLTPDASAIDLKGMSNLADALFNSTAEMKFNINGKIQLNILGGVVDLPITVDAQIGYIDGKIYGYVHFLEEVSGLATIATNTNYTNDGYMFISDSDIYMYKDSTSRNRKYVLFGDYVYKTTTEKRYCTADEMGENVMDIMFWLLDLSDFIQNTIKDQIEKGTSGDNPKLDRLIKAFSYDEANKNVKLTADLKNGLDNGSLGDVNATIYWSPYTQEGQTVAKNYLSRLTGDITLVSVIKITMDLKETACFGNPINIQEKIDTKFPDMGTSAYQHWGA